MKLLRPYYYDEFKCIGNKCINHCCKGWEISIDEESYNYYQSLKTPFGEKLKQSIVSDGMGHYFKLSENKVCPNLNEERLCNIYIELGEDKICSVCDEYPRMSAVHADVIEQTLLLSCPEVARILIECEEQIYFICDDDVKSDIEESSVDDMLYNVLSEARSCSVDIMQMRTFSLWERQLLLLLFTNKIQECIDKNDYSDIENIIIEFSDTKRLSLYVIASEKMKMQKNSRNMYINNIIGNLIMSNLNKINYLKEIYERQIGNVDQMTLYDFLIKHEQEFNRYIEDKMKMYENFYVHTLFRHYMRALSDKNIMNIVTLTNIGYLFIHTYQIISWVDAGKQLITANNQMIFNGFSLSLEHYIEGYDKIYSTFKEHNLTSPAFQVYLLSQ